MTISTCNSCKFKNLSLTNLRLYHYAGNNPITYTDPDGNWINFVIGAGIGFVAASASEIAQKRASGQTWADATRNTFTSKKSWAIIIISTGISAMTSGCAGLEVKAATASTKTIVSAAAKEGTKEIFNLAKKITLINVKYGAFDAGFKDVTKKMINGTPQDIEDTIVEIEKGMFSAFIFSGLTESCIAIGTTSSGKISNVRTGLITDFKMNQPKWAGSVGIMGESVIPTAIDLGKEANQINTSKEQN